MVPTFFFLFLFGYKRSLHSFSKYYPLTDLRLQPIRAVCYSLNMPDAFLTQTLLLLFPLLACPLSSVKNLYLLQAQILLHPQNQAEVIEPKLNFFCCSLCKRSNRKWYLLPFIEPWAPGTLALCTFIVASASCDYFTALNVVNSHLLH